MAWRRRHGLNIARQRGLKKRPSEAFGHVTRHREAHGAFRTRTRVMSLLSRRFRPLSKHLTMVARLH